MPISTSKHRCGVEERRGFLDTKPDAGIGGDELTHDGTDERVWQSDADAGEHPDG